MPFRWHTVTCMVFLPLVIALIGCGDDGTHVSGKVTFNGQPVPQGKVYILPDASAGHSGASGYADIKDGTYDTAADGGHAATPGPSVIRVDGYDPKPPPGADPEVTTTRLFSGYETKFEVGSGATVHDIEVPAEAAKLPPSRPESGSGGGAVTP